MTCVKYTNHSLLDYFLFLISWETILNIINPAKKIHPKSQINPTIEPNNEAIKTPIAMSIAKIVRITIIIKIANVIIFILLSFL